MTRRCLRLRLRISISCGEKSFPGISFSFPSLMVNPTRETFLIEKVKRISVQLLFTYFSNQFFNEKRLDTHHLLLSMSITTREFHTTITRRFPLWKTPFMLKSKLKKITELILMRSR